jgi:hypothetical protein
MPQFHITATSEKKPGMEVSNTNTKRFPSPGEFADQAAADAHAKDYAKDLNKADHEGVWDWKGKATLVA